MPQLKFDSVNPHFKNKYVSLNAVLEGVLPVLQKHNILLTQWPDEIHGQPGLVTKLTWVSGDKTDTLEAVTPLVLAKATPQEFGSALTYFRRYAILSILGLVGDEDDDAEVASPKPTPKTKDAPTPRETKEKKKLF
jgi:hypothetical protein